MGRQPAEEIINELQAANNQHGIMEHVNLPGEYENRNEPVPGLPRGKTKTKYFDIKFSFVIFSYNNGIKRCSFITC